MKQNLAFLRLFAILLTFGSFLTGCAAIGDIFKAGVWGGIILSALVIGLIIFIIMKLGKRN